MSSRFECPKCQFVFLAREAPSSDCPACGSLATPAGQASMGHDISHYADQEDFAPPRASGAGIFGDLMDEKPAQQSSPNIHKVPAFDNGSSPRVFSGEGDAFSAGELDDFDPFGAVPDSGFDLGRGETKVQTITTRIQEKPHASSDEPFAPRSTIVVDPSLDGPALTQAAPDLNAGLSSELFEDLSLEGSPAHEALEMTALPVAPTTLPRPRMQATMPVPPVHDADARSESPFGADTEVDGHEIPRSAALSPFSDDDAPDDAPLGALLNEATLEEGDLSLDDEAIDPPSVHDEPTGKNRSALGESSEEESPFARDFESPLQPEPPGDLLPTNSGELRPGAVLLSALEAQMDGATPLDLNAGDSFDALEQAFEQAERPESARSALLSVSEDMGMSSANIPLRAEDVASSIPAPPQSVPRRRAVDLPHLSLSKDTLALAGLPMPRGANINAAHALTREDVKLPSSALSPLREEEDAPYVAPPFAAASAELDRNTDPALSVEIHQIEPTYSGFTPLRVALGVVAFLIAGLILGAILAPGKVVDETPRGQATALLAEGNQAFAEGRTEVALEKYRNAIVKDQTFSEAYRAKAIALAKSKGREAEAVAAYEKYLKVADNAADASEIKEIIARYKGTP